MALAWIFLGGVLVYIISIIILPPIIVKLGFYLKGYSFLDLFLKNFIGVFLGGILGGILLVLLLKIVDRSDTWLMLTPILAASIELIVYGFYIRGTVFLRDYFL